MSLNATQKPEKKDKQKVIGEAFTDEMIQGYLTYEPKFRQQADFDRLIRAYRGLPESAFARLIALYKDEGLDVNPKDKDGQAFLDLIRRYESFPAYVHIIEQALAHGKNK